LSLKIIIPNLFIGNPRRFSVIAQADTLLLSMSDVEKCLDMSQVITIVEETFHEQSECHVVMPAKVTLDMSNIGIPSWTNIMPAYVHSTGIFGIKCIGGFADNQVSKALPYLMGTLILGDPQTGLLIAVMDATHITSMRTGASAAVAARYLARPNSRIATLIGCGIQGRATLHALSYVLNLEEIRAVDIDKRASESLVNEAARLNIRGKTINDRSKAIKGADIIVTATTADEPLVLKSWVREGVLIISLGSYQELHTGLILGADKRIVDHRIQALHRGEFAHLFSSNQLSSEDIYAELGEIIGNKMPGRESNDEIIISALIGMAIEDVAVGASVVKRAKQLGLGRCFNFLC
jgi:alanine dehydrogenase